MVFPSNLLWLVWLGLFFTFCVLEVERHVAGIFSRWLIQILWRYWLLTVFLVGDNLWAWVCLISMRIQHQVIAHCAQILHTACFFSFSWLVEWLWLIQRLSLSVLAGKLVSLLDVIFRSTRLSLTHRCILSCFITNIAWSSIEIYSDTFCWILGMSNKASVVGRCFRCTDTREIESAACGWRVVLLFGGFIEWFDFNFSWTISGWNSGIRGVRIVRIALLVQFFEFAFLIIV